ncbi:MAG: hypothetical protein PHR30_03850 [Gallionellaceae bacterium]|nr:hypothetical protein [Gallionellaceae bacterium]MDD5364448.1 hypothetical protein [Gallionellaceae bacterium]
MSPMPVQEAGKDGRQNPELVLVCGPWSSGTTAVAGILEKLGLRGGEPYFRTNDARTKNSYESLAFRDLTMSLASEADVAMKVPRTEALAALREFRTSVVEGDRGETGGGATMFLKYPLSALLIPEISQVFNTRLVYVLRPVQDIEATRLRRGWSENLGGKGARRLYGAMFDVLINLSIPTMIIRYPELLARPMPITRQLAAFSGLQLSDAEIEAAAGFVRRAGG